MIRREISLPGNGQAWALISQVEHAHLAAELARGWQTPLLPTAYDAGVADDAEGELLQAIEHHDDGWAEWEEAPDIDPQHGRPRSFTEMPQAASLAIWSKSIAVAEHIGPLAAWVVSGHFAALLQSGRGGDALDGTSPAADWLELERSRQEAWKQEWICGAPGRGEDALEHGLRALQFFDAASLWFCCTCPAETEPPRDADSLTLALPGGTESQFTFPTGRASPPLEHSGSIHPWPFEHNEKRLSVSCHTAPKGRYEGADGLLLAWQSSRLTWRMAAHGDVVDRGRMDVPPSDHGPPSIPS